MLVGLLYSGSTQTLASGIDIDGINVGGLSVRAAQAMLERRSAQLENTPVAFVAGTRRFTLTPAELGVAPDWAAAVATAENDGNGLEILRGFRRLELSVLGVDIKPSVSSYSAAVDYELGLIADRLDHPVRQARIVRRGLSFEVLDGEAGLALDRTIAAQLLVSALARTTRSGVVELPVSTVQPTISPGQLAGERDQAAIALSAPVTLTLGTHRFELTPRELAPMIGFEGSGLVLGGEAADHYFAKLSGLMGQPASGARFGTAGDRVWVIPAQSGRALDVPVSAAAVLAAAERTSDRVAALAVSEVNAGRSTAAAEAMGITGLVSSYETVYGGVANRIHNVELVAHLINGTLIAPGATFSFNKTTGARTAAKGFLVAPVIINGEVSTGLGGGVCQVSTTVFNAAFVAGLPITARTNHALYISHYPLGRDATVDYPDIDLRFVNDTPHWLLLRTVVAPSSLVVSLYGTPQHRRVVTQTTPLIATGKMPIAPRLDSSLAPGERVILDPGVPPQSTSVRRLVYAPDGKLLSDATWYSNYDAVPEIVLVGPRHHVSAPTKSTGSKSTTKIPTGKSAAVTGAGASGSTTPSATTTPATTTPSTTTTPGTTGSATTVATVTTASPPRTSASATAGAASNAPSATASDVRDLP